MMWYDDASRCSLALAFLSRVLPLMHRRRFLDSVSKAVHILHIFSVPSKANDPTSIQTFLFSSDSLMSEIILI